MRGYLKAFMYSKETFEVSIINVRVIFTEGYESA